MLYGGIFSCNRSWSGGHVNGKERTVRIPAASIEELRLSPAAEETAAAPKRRVVLQTDRRTKWLTALLSLRQKQKLDIPGTHLRVRDGRRLSGLRASERVEGDAAGYEEKTPRGNVNISWARIGLREVPKSILKSVTRRKSHSEESEEERIARRYRRHWLVWNSLEDFSILVSTWYTIFIRLWALLYNRHRSLNENDSLLKFAANAVRKRNPSGYVEYDKTWQSTIFSLEKSQPLNNFR